MDKNRHTIHIGASHSFRKPQTKKEFGFSLRPGAHISSKYLTALVEDVNHVNAFNFETSFVLNSIAIQSEYLHVTAKNNLKNEKFDSFYVQTSYFLTGERRAYKNALNGFGRVIPKSNFGDGGTGAFEFALRFSSATGLNNDRMNVFTAGLNWHLNSATRIMLNQIISNIDNTTQYTGKGTFKAFQMRFQIDF
mgnify:CR=1 FL=1